MSKILVVAIALGFAVLRFLLPAHGLRSEDLFKDAAHLFLGGLVGAGIGARRWWPVAVAGALTVVELAAFFAKR